MMLTNIQTDREYTAQIVPYHGSVKVEIVYRNLKDKLDPELYYVCAYKTFGSVFASSLKEKHFIKAKKWVNEQLDIIGKHSTVIIKKPEFLNPIN